MKIKIKELNPNPFKKEINKGELNEATVEKIRANMKELGLMGALPVFQKEGKSYLISGHHRLEAMKREFGEDYEIKVEVHEYSEDQVLKGMVVENFTQRNSDSQEIMENLAMIRNYLRRNCSSEEHFTGKGGRGKEEPGSIRHISEWLDKGTGEVMKVTSISDYLSMEDNLDEELKETVKNTHGLTNEEKETALAKRVGAVLSKIVDKEEQRAVAERLKALPLDAINKERLVNEYRKASEETKKKVLEDEIELTDIKMEEFAKMVEKKAEEAEERDKEKEKGISFVKISKYQDEMSFGYSDVNNKIIQQVGYLNTLMKEGIIKEMDWKKINMIVKEANKLGKGYVKINERIMETIEL